MQIYQKLLINEIKKELYLGGKIREFHPKKEKYLELIKNIKQGKKVKIPQKFVKESIKKSKSEYTKQNIKDYQGYKRKTEKVKYSFTNKRNLRIIYEKEGGDILIIEYPLKKEKYTYAQLYDIAYQKMINLNLAAKKNYDAQLVNILDFYIVTRHK